AGTLRRNIRAIYPASSIQRTTSDPYPPTRCRKGGKYLVSIAPSPSDAEIHRCAPHDPSNGRADSGGPSVPSRRVWRQPPRHPVQRAREQDLLRARRAESNGDREAPREDRNPLRLDSRSGVHTRLRRGPGPSDRASQTVEPPDPFG